MLGDSGQAVAVTPVLVTESLSSTLGPGDTAELAALFPENWGLGGSNRGSVWLTLSGSGIFDTKMVELSGQTLIHKFEIEKRFGSVVYAAVAYPTASGRWDERAAAFRIVPKSASSRSKRGKRRKCNR